MLSQLDHKIFGLESIKELYATDVDFKESLESIKELYATDVDFKDAYENCRERENME
jgi:hypothetical protein